MNIFEYMAKILKEELNKALEEMPMLMLDMDEDQWTKLLGDNNANL